MFNHNKKFKGSRTEIELERLYSNDLLDLTSSARQAYDLSPNVSPNDMTFENSLTTTIIGVVRRHPTWNVHALMDVIHHKVNN